MASDIILPAKYISS